MKADIFQKIKKIKNKKIRLSILDRILNHKIPFNRRLKLKIQNLTPLEVAVSSPAVTARQNHIKGAHACALATMGEYPAGLLLAQNFSPKDFRFILKDLNMVYEKQGKGALLSSCKVKSIKPPNKTKETWYKMTSNIHNEHGDLVATCNTNWQVKPWKLIKEKK